jgi:hypothetical protein
MTRRESPSFDRSAFVGYRFPPDVIVLAVRWYLRYGLSYRDVEELLAERGIAVDTRGRISGTHRVPPEPDDVDAGIEVAARLADYVTVLEPLRRIN